MMIRFTDHMKIMLLVTACVMMTPVVYSAESIAINLSAVNPTTERVENKPVKFYLPHELSRTDVIDSGTMDVRFDESRSTLFLYKEADLNPGEAVQFRIVFKDVWRIADDEFRFIENQIDNRLQYLESTDEYDTGSQYAKFLKSRLEAIQLAQKQSDSKETAQRIEDYRIYLDQINEIRKNVTVMSDFVKEATRFKDQKTVKGLLKFVVKAKNPLDREVSSKIIRKYLPRGVVADQIVDGAGFAVKYDPGKGLYYLEQAVSFEPLEQKTFEVTVRNVWMISEEKLNRSKEEAEELNARLYETQYEDTGNEIIEEINGLIESVILLQNSAKSPVETISNFALNKNRVIAVEQGVERLRKLVEEIESQVPQTVPFYTKDKTPDISTTWKIIFGMIAFIIVLSGIFYIILALKAGKQINVDYEIYEG